MNSERIEEMLKSEWPQEAGGRQHLPVTLGERPMRSSVRLRSGSRSGLGVAAAVIVLIIGGTLLTGAWLHIQAPTASPSATATLGESSSATPGATPTASPTASPFPSAQTGFFRATGSTLASVSPDVKAILLRDGRVLIVDLPDAELFDPSTGAFSATGPEISSVRFAPSVTLLQDGDVLVAGGGAGSDGKQMYDSAELYDPATGKFTATGSMHTARQEQSATLLADGDVLIAGGVNTSGYLASAELYDPRTGRFTETGSMPTPTSDQGATLLKDGRVLLAGGYTSTLAALASAELYDPKTGTFGAAGSMSIARALGTTTMLADGRVLVAGGSPTDGPGAYTALASAEIFDPQTDRFTPTGSMAAARIHASATLLQDGRVLMVGGEDLQGSGRLAEIYDPAAGTFRVTGPMTTARRGLAAVMLESGQVLVVGGDTRGGKTAELYNP